MGTSVKAALDKLFRPGSLAVAGASRNSRNLGSRTLRQIRKFGFPGLLYAVNPKGEPSGPVPGYTSVRDIPGAVDLCILAVPARAVAQTISDCAAKNIPAAQILTGGFAEAGEHGRRAEAELLERAAGITRLIGPNCLGIYSPGGGLTMADTAEKTQGHVSVASQSGGLSIDMILQAKARGLLLSKLISIGNCADLDPVDFLIYLGEDPETQVIGLYLEGVQRGEEMFAALRNIHLRKPVVILKGGRTNLGARSVASHTNSLAGEYSVLKAGLRQTGAVLAEDVDSFLASLTALQDHVPRPQGPRMVLVGNGGGSTVLATDLLEEKAMTLATLNEETECALEKIEMPPGSSVGRATDTPVTAMNTAGSGALAAVIDCLVSDPGVDGAILHFNLLPFTNYENREDIADGVGEIIRGLAGRPKPVFLALRGTPDTPIESLRQRIMARASESGIPCFFSANEAVAAMAAAYDWTISSDIHLPLTGQTAVSAKNLALAQRIIGRAIEAGTTWLSQNDAFAILSLFGLPHPPCDLVSDPEGLEKTVSALGFPLVMKIDSPDIIHKTDAGGVIRGVENIEQARRAYDEILTNAQAHSPNARRNGVFVQQMASACTAEMICGLKRDPVFGLVLLLGLGGIMVELVRDVSLRVSPLRRSDPGQMWQELAGARLLEGFRGGKPADTGQLEKIIRRLELLGRFLPEIKEMDLNPVFIREQGQGAEVVDCRILIDQTALR